MEQTCLNCNYPINENFCSNCGQKKFKRIDKKYVADELQYLLIHTNKGFLYTLKKLIKSPGKTAREYIDGNRVNHYKPLLLTFILSGISAFISFKIIGLNKIMNEFHGMQYAKSAFMNDINSFISSYYSIMMLVLIPFFAFATWLAFHKWKSNYYEHIVMNAYILSTQNIITIVLISPILYFLRNNTTYFLLISSSSMLISPVVLIWFFKGFYADKPLKQILWRVLGAIGLIVVIIFILMIMVVIAGLIYGLVKGPEAMKYFAPTQA